MPKLISVKGDGHCCHRPSSNWETKALMEKSTLILKLRCL